VVPHRHGPGNDTESTAPLKILHLTDMFSPSIGGMEGHILELVRERQRRGHEIVVVTLQKIDGPSNEIEDNGYRVYRIDGGYTKLTSGWSSADKPYHPPAPDPVVAYRLRQILDVEKPDVVHAHNWMIYSYLAIKGPKSPPVLWMQHDYSLACAKKTAMYFTDDRACPGPSLQDCLPCSVPQYGKLKGAAITVGLFGSNAALRHRVDGIASNSTAVQTFSHNVIRGDRDFGVVPGFLPPGSFDLAATTPRPTWLPDGDFILFVGALGTYKGLFDLLAAYKTLRDSPPLVVIGTPRPEMPTSWPENTTVRVNAPRDQVLAAWRFSAFGVIPSRWPEPFGLAVLEAGAVGRTVVATRGGGLADLVIDDATGLLVTPGNTDELAAAMQRLCDSPELRARLGAAARVRASEYTVERAADRLDEICRELVSHRA
jgi:glycosyltransferase involved in cell wall biosynthesis